MNRRIPQRLKPASLLVLGGTAEAVPFPSPVYETESSGWWLVISRNALSTGHEPLLGFSRLNGPLADPWVVLTMVLAGRILISSLSKS
jgi:hypothetical protein